MNEEEKELYESIRLLEEFLCMKEQIESGEALKLRGTQKGLFMHKYKTLKKAILADWPEHPISIEYKMKRAWELRLEDTKSFSVCFKKDEVILKHWGTEKTFPYTMKGYFSFTFLLGS